MTRSINVKASPSLLNLEASLKKEWVAALVPEELLWMRKSHVDWLRMGDKNMKFFHTSTLTRRRMNRVEMLRNEAGEWVSDNTELKDLAVAYYNEPFSSDLLAGGTSSQEGSRSWMKP